MSEEASNMVTRAEFEMLMKQINENDKKINKKIGDGDEALKKRIRTLEAQGRIYTSLVGECRQLFIAPPVSRLSLYPQ